MMARNDARSSDNSFMSGSIWTEAECLLGVYLRGCRSMALLITSERKGVFVGTSGTNTSRIWQVFVSFQQASGVCQVGYAYHAIYTGNERRLWPQVTVSCELVACSVKAWLQSECGVRSKQVSGEVYFHELARPNRGIGGGGALATRGCVGLHVG